VSPASAPEADASHCLEPRWVLPMDPGSAVLEGHAVVLVGPRIAAVLPRAEARARFPGAARVSLPSHAVLPGLINLHTHAAMALLRGMADDLPLATWLADHIWPAEGRLMSDAFVHDGTLLAAAEMLRGGVTCFHDMYFFPDAAARAARTAGIRAVLGLVVLEFPTPYASDAAAYLARGREVQAALADDPLIATAVAPHAPYTVGDGSFRAACELADAHGLPLHVHLHETEREIQDSLDAHGRRPLARLDALGAVGPRLIAAHGVHLTDAEMDLLAERGAHVAHCPAANLKLASGLAPVAALRARGVNVGIGTDGAASNNRLDMLSELRLTALLAKGVAGRADALPAHEVLAMATCDAARALGLGSRIGALRAGLDADVIAVDLGASELQPCYDPVSHLVYAAGREHVTHVWVRGRPVVAGGRLQTIDPGDLTERAETWRRRVRP